MATRRLRKGTSTKGARSSRVFPIGWRFALACFLYHLTISVAIRGAEAPDEWWQSAEIAYYLVFHKGTPTWEWRQGIRSVFFPSLFALGFKILQLLHIDSPRTVYISGRITQAAILTAIHVMMCRLAQRLEHSLCAEVGPAETPPLPAEGHQQGWYQRLQGVFLSPSLVPTVARLGCVQWYFLYAGVRAYSNVTESLFFLLALSSQTLPLFLVWAGFACMTRVTAAISLMPIFCDHLLRLRRRHGGVKGTALAISISSLMVCVFAVAIVTVDYLFYERIVLTPYEFIKSNIGDDVSSLFGEHSWHWYVLLAMPLMVGLHYIFAFAAPYVLVCIRAGPRTRHDVQLYVACLVWTLLVHSFVSHKEMRFVYSLVPLSMLLGAFVAVCAVRYPTRLFGKQHQRKLVLLRVVYVGSIVLNVVLLVSIGFFVREGCVGIMSAVRHGPREYRTLDVVTHCYFVPGYTHVHGKVDTLRLVDCPVVLDAAGLPEPTEDWLLRRDGARFVWWKYARRELPATDDDDAAAVAAWYRVARQVLPLEAGSASLPDGIILFQELAEVLETSFLGPRGYTLTRRVHHLSFMEDEGTHVDLWSREDTPL